HSNLVNLRKTDIIKFVVGNVEEVQFSLGIKKMIEKDYPSKVLYAFSPLMPDMSPKLLADLLLEHKEDDIILSVQIHKIIDFK
ncbi:MAG: hypothetical protein GY797_38445, partial [Deltaproteobacteria bacterium]|nr:hypothetical protein [Deltaproteobacteria bacterium]